MQGRKKREGVGGDTVGVFVAIPQNVEVVCGRPLGRTFAR
jgi:hypothetical protein